jgi:hypothetical protein
MHNKRKSANALSKTVRIDEKMPVLRRKIKIVPNCPFVMDLPDAIRPGRVSSLPLFVEETHFKFFTLKE